MADSKTVSGSKDDLLVDLSRCLRMRFCDSSCRLCADICPQGAVTLDNGLAINPGQCRGCLLCTTVCPAGALEQNTDFPACIAQLAKVPEPVLGCICTHECANATVACLGGLSAEHLVTLCHSLTGKLTLNLSRCSDCANNAMISRLRQRLDDLAAAGLSEGGCSIVPAESATAVRYRATAIDRRGFFKSFGNSLFTGAAVMLSATNVQTGKRSEYAVKRLPVRRQLLHLTRSRLSSELEARVRNRFDYRVTCDESCRGCQGCVAICPTGALQTGSTEEPPVFDPLRCTGCGLCVEFCLDEALRVQPFP